MSVMCRLLKYCVSHTLYAAMTRLEEVNKEVNMWSSVRCLGYLSSLNFLIAICLGLYVRWEKTAETIILVIFILGLFVLGMASIFYYYFNMEKVGLCLHLWFGFLIGLLCFLHNPALEEDAKEKASSYMLVASVVLRALWALLERLCGCYRQRPLLITSAELLELMGFAAASTALLIQKSVSLAALAAALATLIVNLRVKSYLAVLNLVGFAVITGEVFFKSLKMSTNPFALGCFFSRLVCEPLLDVYFSGLSVTERWQPVLRQGGFWRRLSLLPLVAMETAFLVLAARKMASVERWYVVIPIVSASSLLWVVCHVVFLVTLWAFHSKLSGCQRVCPAQRSEGTDAVSLDRVMASRGMRHFCLISERLVMFSLVSTGVLAAVSWQESNSLFLSMLLLVLALESLCHGLFKELGSSLGGTMLGYAMVIPTNYCSRSPDGQPTLLPPDQVQDLNLRSTSILNNVQRFFSHHMVEPFGCDYSTSGLGGAALRGKLRAFLEARTADGPRHDTYLLFYSGHTHRSGEWALAGGDALRLDELVQLWREKNAGHCSRLIVLLDTENSMPWVMAVPRVEGLYVAVQGARLVRSADPELQAGPQLGDFTAQWVDFNCNPDSNVHWAERGRAVVAAYGVSKWWGDYSLHLPTESDVADHWSLYFPRWTNQVVQLSQPASGLNLFWLCGLWERFLRRLKLAWCPPAVLDTGQGFKLVRS